MTAAVNPPPDTVGLAGSGGGDPEYSRVTGSLDEVHVTWNERIADAS